MGFLNENWAIRINRGNLGRGRGLKGFYFWPKGSCMSSVGPDEQVVRGYIRTQDEEERRHEQCPLGGFSPLQTT